MKLDIKQIKNIERLGGGERRSINFTDGSNLVVRYVTFPFRVVDAQGMMAQLFHTDKSNKALFGWPEKENSIALKLCHEWDERLGFDQSFTDWRDYFRFVTIGEVVDKRKSGTPIILHINNRGDIISP